MSLTTNLQSYYKLDSNSNDSVGAVNGTDTLITYTAGRVNNAGTNTTGNIALGTGSFSITTAMSISLWFNTTNVATNQIMIQKNNGVAAATDSWYIYALPATNIIQTFIGNGTSNVFANHSYTFSASTWTHLVFTYDTSSGNQRLFINGALISTVGGGPTPINSIASSVVLMNYVTGTIPFIGKIDEVGIWNRVLTNQEIIRLYNNGVGLSHPFQPLSPGFLFQHINNQ